MLTIGNKIRLLRERANQSRQVFGQLIGVPEAKVQAIEIGKQRVDHETLANIVTILGIDANYLLRSDASLDEILPDAPINEPDYIQIPKFTVSASAGNGATNDTEDAAGHYAFSRRWIKRRGLSSDSLAVITVTGDSMEPKLRDNDLILVNRDEISVRDGKPYVVRIGGELLVKYVQRLGENQVTLLSANTFYPPRTIDLPEGDTGTIQIIGRVVASMHEW
jgi:phage repressor protein C with HTH and peptisase S24 domain